MRKNQHQPTVHQPNTMFTGEVYMTPLHAGTDPSRIVFAQVRFTPGARTHWHTHCLGQTLIGNDGLGLVVSRDGTVHTIRPGEVVQIDVDEEHWHGAMDDSMMAHYALLENDGPETTTWLEPVTDEEYAAANQTAREALRAAGVVA